MTIAYIIYYNWIPSGIRNEYGLSEPEVPELFIKKKNLIYLL